MSLRPWTHTTSRAARDLVSRVIVAQPGPVTTQQLYKLVVQHEYEVAGKGPSSHAEHAVKGSVKPPHPSHVIRSMSYLKRVVLPDLLQRKEVEKVHTVRNLSQEEIDLRLKSMTKAARRSAELVTTADTWVWQRRTPPTPTQPKPAPALFGLEVGRGADWSHLNKRRQRSRSESVARDMAWVRELQRARREGLQEQVDSPVP